MQATQGKAWANADELKPALSLALALEHAQMGLLMLRDDVTGELYPAVGVGLTPEQCAEFSLDGPGLRPFGQASQEHRRVTIRDAARDGDGFGELARGIGFRGLDVLPLSREEGPPLGAMGMFFRRARVPTRHSAKLVELCALIVSSALESARLRAEAERAREDVEEASRSKLNLLARISHELRTPLQSIAGYVDLLKLGIRGRVNGGQVDYLTRIEKSQEILLGIIDDLITFSRLEVGHVEYHIDAVTVRDALAEAELIVAPLMRERQMRFEVGEVPSEWIVRADADKTRQVLVNLLANALKYTPAGGTVRVTGDADEQWVTMSVSDTGPGIPEDKLQAIFQPYVQLELTAVGHFGGSGLGLAICREFAAGMGGELLVTSAPGQGSTFTFKLQRVSPAELQSARASVESAPPELQRRSA